MSRTERLKCMNEYDEIIMDRVENGQSEETIVRELGDVKKIAYGLLAEYAEGARSDRKKALSQFNKTYMLLDVCLMIITYFLAYFICFHSNVYMTYTWKLPVGMYVCALFGMIPLFLIVYYLNKLYTVEIYSKIHAGFNIVKSNAISGILMLLILYLGTWIDFSRSMLVFFIVMNCIAEILLRNYLAKYFFVI